jgi:hypothetical protein
MISVQPEWIRGAGDLQGPRFAEIQTGLTRYNAKRFEAGLPEGAALDQPPLEGAVAAEIDFIETVRREIAPLTDSIPCDPDRLPAWFEGPKKRVLGRATRYSPGSPPARRRAVALPLPGPNTAAAEPSSCAFHDVI